MTRPSRGRAERVYFCRLRSDSTGQTRVLLKNRQATQGVSLAWNAKQMPCFTLWKNETAVEDGYVTGLEPGTNYPNPRSFEAEQGRVVKLAGGERRDLQLSLTVLDSASSIAKMETEIESLRRDDPTDHLSEPQPGWCA